SEDRPMRRVHATQGNQEEAPSMMVSIKLAAATVLVALVLALAGCGSSSTSTTAGGVGVSPGIQTPLTQTVIGGKRGGTLTVLNLPDFEHTDRGGAYSSPDSQAIYATQRPLYSYKPDSFGTLTPDMASGPPLISADRKTLTVQIRKGVHFSPPVNREV